MHEEPISLPHINPHLQNPHTIHRSLRFLDAANILQNTLAQERPSFQRRQAEYRHPLHESRYVQKISSPLRCGLYRKKADLRNDNRIHT